MSVGAKCWKQENQLWSCSLMQMTDDSGTEQGDNRRNGEKWLDSECILKEDSTKEC